MNTRLYSLLFILGAGSTFAQVIPATPGADSATVELDPFVVTGNLDHARDSILPSLGASSFLITEDQIANQSQGSDASFSQILLRAPGVAADSAANGDLHVRGEHGNLQYRINNVLLPEGLSGFGLELDPRFVNSVQFITGSLPAQYGFRTAGVVDIKTKSGALDQGGDFSIYGGSFDTIRPSFETGGTSGKLTYFVDGSYEHNSLGIENPTPSAHAIHDATNQEKLFAYLGYILDSTSRVTFMASGSYSTFQVPNTPGLDAGTSPNGTPWVAGTFDSSLLNENQKEQNDFAVVSYQKSTPDLNLQLSAFGRFSGVHFLPDPIGDLYFNGVASDVNRKLSSGGLQGDASYLLAADHTLRFGGSLLDESVSSGTVTTVFPVDDDGDATGPAYAIANRSTLHGLFAGVYVQDEWKLAPQVTLNYGARFDVFNSSFDDETQLSPRINLVWQPTDTTTVHAGYARYFTPPPIENISGSTLAQFDGTSNASAIDQDDPVKAERSDYFDAGITRKIGDGFQIGLDGYYKHAKNQLDDGLFGQTLILSAFNYAEGKIYGVELSGSYTKGGFTTYANLARSSAEGKDWVSSQFLFDPADLAYVKNHWISLDHDQTLSGSFGASYQWNKNHGGPRVYVDVIYGSGLRNDATAADGSTIPNGGSVPDYITFNVGGEKAFTLGGHKLTVRLDLVNLADKSYQLRDGSGVGVNAAQYGQRFGAFGSVKYTF